MDADVLADDEFHARQPDAVIGQHRGVKGEFGIAEIDHDLGARPRHRCGRHPRDLERQLTLVDRADLAIGAADRDHSYRRRAVRCSFGADHRRDAEFAGDDGCMAGAPAMVW